MTFDLATQIYLHQFTEAQAASVNARRWLNWAALGCYGTPEEYEQCFVRAVETEHKQEPLS